MSKELTERFTDDCLDCGFYYASIPDEGVIILRSSDRHYLETYDGNKIDILSAVPSYDEWKQAKENLNKNGTWYTERSYKLLEKKLEIATKALKEYANCKPTEWMSCVTADIALKEMEGVK